MNNSKLTRKNTGIINPSKEKIKVEKTMEIESEPHIENLDFESDDEILEIYFNKLVDDIIQIRNVIDRMQDSIADIRHELDKKEDKKVIEF